MKDQKVCLSNCSIQSGYPYLDVTNNNSNVCLDSCTGEGKVIINGTQCGTECPSSFKYRFNDINSTDSYCLNNCSDFTSPLYEVNSTILPFTCVETCGSTYPYKLKDDTGKLTCTNECSGYNSYYLNFEDKECVRVCPNDKRYHYPWNQTCVSNCNDAFIDEESKTCVADCTKIGKKISGEGNKCVLTCTGDYPYIEDDKCVPECSSNKSFVLGENNECIENCTTEYPLVFGNKCVQHCQDELSYQINDTCVTTCPDDLPYTEELSTIWKCVSECEIPVPYIDSDIKSCTDTCPSLKPYILPPKNLCVAQCNSDNPYKMPNKTCVAHCEEPAKYLYGNECYSSCKNRPVNKYRDQNDNCVSSCNDAVYFYLVNQELCSDSCGDTYLFHILDTNECLSSCPNDTREIKLQKKCVTHCPTEYPNHSDQGDFKYCTDSCADFGQYLISPGLCADICVNSYIMPPNNECVAQCDGSYPYLNFTNRHCVVDCGDNTPYKIMANKTCYPQCPSGYFQIGDTYECIDNCTKTNNHRYIFDSGGIPKCVTTCDSNSYPYLKADNLECIVTCQSKNEFIIEGKNICLVKCVEPVPFLN